MKKMLKVFDDLAGPMYWTGGQGDLSSDPRKAVVLEEGDDDTAMLEAYDWFEASLDIGQDVMIADFEDTYDKMVKWWNENR